MINSMWIFAPSFLLGWMVKSLLVRFGLTAHGGLETAKTLMIGIIAGDLLAGLIFMVHGPIYFALTGVMPLTFRVFPN